MAKTYNDGLEDAAKLIEQRLDGASALGVISSLMLSNLLDAIEGLKQSEPPLQEGDAVITVTVTDMSDSFNYFFNVECMRSGELKNAGHVEWDSTLSPSQHRLIVRRGKPPAYALCGGGTWAAIAKAEQ